MSEKVKLPREVAEAIERTKDKHSTWNNNDLCYIVLNQLGYCQYKNDTDIRLLHDWSNTKELTFAKALINGYEVEETPEDLIKWHHDTWNKEAFNPHHNITESLYRIEGMVITLNILNIKIPGVNADE